MKEITRVSKGRSFIQVDAYRNKEEKKIFLDWVLTAKYHDYPHNWLKLFKNSNYNGDYYWTIVSIISCYQKFLSTQKIDVKSMN